MHANAPHSVDTPFPGYAPLDIERDPFPSDLHWSADDLAEAVRTTMPLHSVVFAPSANDARLHRPRRNLNFLAVPSLSNRFRVGG